MQLLNQISSSLLGIHQHCVFFHARGLHGFGCFLLLKVDIKMRLPRLENIPQVQTSFPKRDDQENV